jgi:hypothetical protein
MTEKPGRSHLHSLVLHRCTGRRNSNGVNEEEASRLLSDCLQQIESERSLGRDSCQSIGILSPFRSQVDHISASLVGSLPADAFDRHDVLVGTAHTFQGEERDRMYISLAVDPASHPAAIRFLEKPDVFNVSITRARVAQSIYTSIDPDELDPDSLLAGYIRHVVESQRENPAPIRDAHRDHFLVEVEQALQHRGYQTWVCHSVGGLLLDLAVAKNGRSCGIDLVGYSGPYESAFHLERYEMFHRAGFRIVPLAYSHWLSRKDECIQAIESTLATSETPR